jgi:hypothetical protein
MHIRLRHCLFSSFLLIKLYIPVEGGPVTIDIVWLSTFSVILSGLVPPTWVAKSGGGLSIEFFLFPTETFEGRLFISFIIWRASILKKFGEGANSEKYFILQT